MYRHAIQTFSKKMRREVVVRSTFFLPAERRRALERWIRGREEHKVLKCSDVAFVSCGKSGRTWLRVLLSRFFQIRFNLPGGSLISHDNFHYMHRDVPRVVSTHDSYLRYYTGNFANKREYRGLKTVVLVRHPADVAVSQYFQWQHRILPRKKWLNEYPEHGAQVGLYEFIRHDKAGLPYVIEFLNDWRREREMRPDLLLVRYEDMLADTARELERILKYLGFDPTPEELVECVAFGSFENMRKLELQGVYWLTGRAMKSGRQGGTNGLKVRRGKAGGWRDDLEGAQIAEIEALIQAELAPGLGYRNDEIAHGDDSDTAFVAASRIREAAI